MHSTAFELFAMEGSSLATGANAPLPLIDPGAAWLVTTGHIDVFAMTITRDKNSPNLSRTHLLRVHTGQLLFGQHPPRAGRNVLLLGFGSPDAQVTRITLDRLATSLGTSAEASMGSQDLEALRQVRAEVMTQIDRWVTSVSTLCMGSGGGGAPTGTRNLRPGARIELADTQSAQPQAGVLWVRPIKGNARFMDQDGPCSVCGSIAFPLGKDAWVTADGPCELECLTAATLVPDTAYWDGLEAFHAAVETVIDLQRMREKESNRRRLLAKSAADKTTVAAAFGDLESILHEDRAGRVAEDGAQSTLLAAVRLVCIHDGIAVRELPQDSVGTGRADRGSPLDHIVRGSNLAMRRVSITDDWYRRDGGPLLGFIRGGDAPVALLPKSATAYALHDPGDGSVRTVSSEVAKEVEPAAFVFYRRFPDRPLNGLDLVKFAVRGIGRDLWSVMGIGVLGGLLALATPLAVGYIYDFVIPASEHTQLVQLTVGLLIAAVAAGMFQITRSIALTRAQHRAGNALQAAVWDRVINLPTKFFTEYSAGDLATRAMGIDSIMAVLSTSVITTVVSSIFSVFSLALLFVYSPVVALAAMACVGIIVAGIIVCGVAKARYQQELEDGNGKMAGLMLQLINGIAKIRVAAAEGRAFAEWARKFSRLTRLGVRTRAITANLRTFYAGFSILTYMVIFVLISQRVAQAGGSGLGGPGGAGGGSGVSTGEFLAFLAAYVSLLYGMIDLGSTVVGALDIVPIYRRLRPILRAAPELDVGKTDPGTLRGRIEVSNVSFRYKPDGPAILEGVNFWAEPGEFVALVGPSGSGKSSLLRILLGFEHPESGTIAYDGFDAAGLDPRSLRRQIGVVLQDGDLMPGDIFTNIVGSAVDLTHNDAWEAARLAGLNKDIEDMPMGMHTVISEGAGTLSGGQRQRLMIARALVTRPRIVYFDEATSALDNPTQAIVTQSLDRLRATRVVIAHRLSTIVGADRIFVLDKGKVAQVGTYEELMQQRGLFYELVKRQIA